MREVQDMQDHLDPRASEYAEKAADNVCNLAPLVRIVHRVFPLVGSDDAYRIAAYAVHLAHARTAESVGDWRTAAVHMFHAEALLSVLAFRTPERRAAIRVRNALHQAPYGAVQPAALLDHVS